MKDIPVLDQRLIQRANDSSNAFDFGNTTAEKYKANIAEIGKMSHLDENSKEKVIEKLFKLRSIELATQGNAIGPDTFGPAVFDKARLEKNLDKAVFSRVNADGYMKKLREDEQKSNLSQKKNLLVEEIQRADKEGLKEITVDGKTYYKLSKNWATKKPNQFKR